jgi:hypothetical protein
MFILFLSVVYAQDVHYLSNGIRYTFHVDNQPHYKHEAILLDVNITQEEHSPVMLFKFTLQKSKNYSFHQIKFKENSTYHHLKHYYQYLVYPNQEGNCSIQFEMIKSITNDNKVAAYAMLDTRDNVNGLFQANGLTKEDTKIELNPLTLNIKAIPHATDMVGDFKLTYHLDKNSTDAYDPVHLHVLLKGNGNLLPMKLIPQSDHYHLFTQEPKVKIVHTIKGTQTDIMWDYAISAKENFTLPKILFKAFNPKTQKLYELKIPAQTITVHQIEKTTLLDKEDTPSSLSTNSDASWFWIFLSYVAVFMAGYLLPRNLWRRKIVLKKSQAEHLTNRIKNAQTHKELLQLLVVQNSSKYHEAINHLEEVVYNNQKIPLEKIKKMLKST